MVLRRVFRSGLFPTGAGLALCLAACLCPVASVSVSAQDVQSPASGSVSAPIVVTTPHPLAPGEKPSAWKRISAEHVVVYSDGSADQLQRVTARLERLHALLARLYPLGRHVEEPVRLTVVLFDQASGMRALGLDNPRTDGGPYAQPFVGERYYEPRVDGSVLAISRTDEIIKLDTAKAEARDCEDFLAGATGADCLDVKLPYHPPAARSWEALLYGAYAQHVVLSHAPAIYPRWYFDGIAAFFSTVVFKDNGEIEYGRPPDDYKQALRSYGRLDTAAVLSGEYLHDPAPLRMDWTPYHAWLLTHFFVFSKLKGEEEAQFRRYMAAVAHGQSMAEAAHAFGDMKRVRYDLLAYSERTLEYATSAKAELPAPLPAEPLSQPAADAMLAGLAPRPFAAAAR